MSVFWLYTIIIPAMICNFAVIKQIVADTVFSGDLQIERVEMGNLVPSVRVSWDLSYPSCFSSLTIFFFVEEDGRERILKTSVVEGSEIFSRTSLEGSDLECNVNIKATIQVTGGLVYRKSTSNSVYTGGRIKYFSSN